MLERMQLIRVFEEKVIELTHKKELEGLVHVGIGQEGVAVGVANALLKKRLPLRDTSFSRPFFGLWC